METPQLTDLILACQLGEREAFQSLFEMYQERVFSISLHFFHGDETLAEDITQDIFVRLFTHITRFRFEAAFSTWLYRMVVNTCIDEQRRRKRVPLAPPIMIQQIADDRQSSLMDRVEWKESLQSVLDQLPPVLRMTVLLRYVEDLSYEEIAAALGCTKGTVASRLHRCQKMLARRLAPLRDTFFPGD